VSTSQLPWPSSVLLPAEWVGVQRLLARCLELNASGTLPGTLLVVSPPGLGREAFALELAAALVCRELGGAGCACAACERVRRGVHPDVEVIAVAPDKTQISIEQAQGVVENITQLPYEGRRRVFIIDSCHTPPLGTDAASALLKTLEEPPPHVTFVLLAANPGRVLPTIASRAVQLRVPPPTPEELAAAVAAAQRCSDARAAELVAAADGDAELVLRDGGERLPETLLALEELVSAALAGDGLAILRTATALREVPDGTGLATAVMLRLASRAGGAGAEGFLDAAAALLVADNRRAVLHLDPESVMVGALAQAANRRSPG
jgi:hypothetical protein